MGETLELAKDSPEYIACASSNVLVLGTASDTTVSLCERVSACNVFHGTDVQIMNPSEVGSSIDQVNEAVNRSLADGASGIIVLIADGLLNNERFLQEVMVAQATNVRNGVVSFIPVGERVASVSSRGFISDQVTRADLVGLVNEAYVCRLIRALSQVDIETVLDSLDIDHLRRLFVDNRGLIHDVSGILGWLQKSEYLDRSKREAEFDNLVKLLLPKLLEISTEEVDLTRNTTTLASICIGSHQDVFYFDHSVELTLAETGVDFGNMFINPAFIELLIRIAHNTSRNIDDFERDPNYPVYKFLFVVADDEHVAICFANNGPMMSEQVLHRLPSISTKGEGRGVGLASCAQLAGNLDVNLLTLAHIMGIHTLQVQNLVTGDQVVPDEIQAIVQKVVRLIDRDMIDFIQRDIERYTCLPVVTFVAVFPRQNFLVQNVRGASGIIEPR